MKPKILGIVGGSMLIFGIFFCAVIFPAFLRLQIRKQAALKPGADIRELWSTFPLPLDFKIYIFNVTNPTEILAGAKPIVQEVGPFFYDVYKHKVNLEDREEDDTVEYNFKSTWYFNPSLSNGLTGEEEVVVPHLFILGMFQITLIEQPKAIGIVDKAVDSIFKKPDTVFVRAKAKDILFDGLPIDCTVKDLAGAATCKVLKVKGENNGLISDGEGRYRFSLFGSRNGSAAPKRIRVLRGVKNYRDVGRVVEYDGKAELSIWSEKHCNRYNGTDATIFPPLIKEGQELMTFAADLCRNLRIQYSHRTMVKGIDTYHYTASLGDMSTNAEEKCYCPTPDTCLTKNLMDMYKCLGLPIIVSLPHFYGSNKKYLEMVEGLDPHKEKYEIAIDLEPMTAAPLQAVQKLQFNMFLHPIEKVKLMKHFPECLFPLFWIEEGILLDDEYVKVVKTLFKVISIVGFLKWLTIFVGACVTGAAGALYFKNKDKNKLNTIKLTPQFQYGKNDEQKKWPPTMNISTIRSVTVLPKLDNN
ncbi:sensory neuron membrane protein 1-like [Osmia bicornis bicornis]|uniref:sensory neuron membrane protein 1-like n=1 Tax=Osmia bicornis bicornis TaxID=1437191 RepID=UPI001EAECA85|nr:sensory neuron membrane protein 1-like [Osmia bicornis bicornis]